MSDQNQILRLLGTIREESAAIRSRQEELFELLISYKDQIEDLKQTVTEKLAGLPTSPYIAGQLVPAPDTIDGTDDFRQLLATYLHGAPPSEEDENSGPVDVEMPPPREVDPSEIQLESEGRPPRSEGRSGGGGRGRGRSRSNSGGPRDSDLERGPDRDVEPFDLQEPDKGGKKKAKRRRRRKKTASKGSSEAPAEAVADD